MEYKIIVKKTLDGGYTATLDVKISEKNPGGVVHGDSAGEVYEILRGRLEAKGHSVIEN